MAVAPKLFAFPLKPAKKDSSKDPQKPQNPDKPKWGNYGKNTSNVRAGISRQEQKELEKLKEEYGEMIGKTTNLELGGYVPKIQKAT